MKHLNTPLKNLKRRILKLLDSKQIMSVKMGAVKMSERIKYLKESPCYQCGVAQQCLAKITRCPRLQEISDYVMPRADYDYHDCMLYKVLMMENKNMNKL